MGALAEIRAAITAKKAAPSMARALGGTQRLKVRVGCSAERSIQCETHDHSVPIYIDGCVVELTEDFAGWEIVEL